MDEFLVLSRLSHFAGAMLLFSASLFRLYVGAGLSKRSCIPASFDRWQKNMLLVAAAATFLSALAWWDALAGSMGEGWADAMSGEMLEAVLFDTEFGQIWIWRLAISVLPILILLIVRRSDWMFRIHLFVAALAAVLLVSLAGVGHAVMQKGLAGITHQIAQAIHLVAAGTWVGGLVPLGYLLCEASRRRRDQWTAFAVHALPRFSRIGYFAVSLVFLSGCVVGSLMIRGWSELFVTLYGRIVLAKICLFSSMTAIALFNRLHWMPRILTAPKEAGGRGGSLRLLWRWVIVEQGIALATLAAASVLGTLQP